ncbi:MAG: S9 family peptidase [Bryobacteraceae bacterium]
MRPPISRLLLAASFAVTAFAAKKPVTIEEAAKSLKAPPAAIWAPAGGRFAARAGDSLNLYDAASGKETKLLDLTVLDGKAKPGPEGPFGWINRGVKEKEIQWLPGGDRLLIARKGDLFLVNAADGVHRQLTNTPATEHDPKVSPDGNRIAFQRDHDLYAMDIGSGKTTRLTRDGSTTRTNAELDWVYPEELAIETAYWWSPDGRRLAYLQFDSSGVMEYPHADLTKVRPVYEPERFPQAGTPNPVVRLGVVGAGGGRTKWFDLPGDSSHLTARVTWMADSSALAVHRLNRIQNKLTLFRVDVNSGKATVILEESDPAWVNLKDDFYFLGKGGELVWGSERENFRHLYMVNTMSGQARAITSGHWEVTDLACVDEASRRIYFLSTEAGPRERQLYSVGFDGAGKRRLSPKAGTHSVTFSPDCGMYLDTHSSISEPPRRAIHKAHGGAPIAVISERDYGVAGEFEILPNEFVEFKAKDGDTFLGRIIKPSGFDPSRKYPAIVQVYGGPHAQTVRDQWRGADWDQYLAHNGYVIWQMDNRGSAFRGHAWEARVNRRFGKQELADQLEGIDYLLSLGFVDPDRIGMQGWSYGGYMTLYSLLNAPSRFRAGISGAPVTDWRHYDTIYTERYMGLPQENEEGYKASSPVHQAANLKAKLMLAHNFEDDNVLFQHTFRMMDALQKAGKHFDLAIYPQKAHAVSGDLRRHLYETMAAFWKRELAGP